MVWCAFLCAPLRCARAFGREECVAPTGLVTFFSNSFPRPYGLGSIILPLRGLCSWIRLRCRSSRYDNSRWHEALCRPYGVACVLNLSQTLRPGLNNFAPSGACSLLISGLILSTKSISSAWVYFLWLGFYLMRRPLAAEKRKEHVRQTEGRGREPSQARRAELLSPPRPGSPANPFWVCWGR
jgi:hypothetical protein